MDETFHTRGSASKTPLFVGLLLGVMAVAAAAVFFLMPRTGTLVVNVSDAKGSAVSHLEVLIDGTKRCESAPCIVRDVATGVHEVKVVAKGYDAPAPRAVTVDGRHDAPTDFQLVAAKASSGTGFKVSAPQTSGVKLQVDGKDVGALPQDVRDLEPGDHKLRFTGDRYQPLEKTISIAKDEVIDLGNMNLKVLKGKATLQLATPGAKVVLVNGATRKEVPQFPMAIEFDPNEKWELVATKDGFDEYKERIAFEDGQAEKTFNITLTPKSSTAQGAAASTGANAPTMAAAAAPPARDRDLATITPKSAPKEAKPAGDKDTSAAAGAETALKINSLPASSVVLDGKPIGTTPMAHVPVSPGTHTIMFINAEQSLKKTISVDVKAGETKAAFAKLREE
jgi:serine/threonine-protein kinase